VPGTREGETRIEHQKQALALGAFVAAAALLAAPAQARFNGSHTLGDFGVQAGTQPGPGFYAAFFYYRYGGDTLKGRNGETIALSPESRSSLGIHAYAPILWYVSKHKVLGANCGALAVIPWANGALEAPFFGLARQTDTGFADMYIRPIDLGWHTTKADVTAGFGFYPPTGRYEAGGSGNTGKGMWTYEPFVGATLYLDEKKTFSVATNVFWELHGTKKDSDTKVGQILTLEGGVGKSYLGGGLIVGADYYAQWKLTADRLGRSLSLPGGGTVGGAGLSEIKHRVFALGPDVTLPVATKKKLYALVNVRYFWETGARTKTQGQTLLITATIPIPSVKL
jgi:hypothetical protein